MEYSTMIVITPQRDLLVAMFIDNSKTQFLVSCGLLQDSSVLMSYVSHCSSSAPLTFTSKSKLMPKTSAPSLNGLFTRVQSCKPGIFRGREKAKCDSSKSPAGSYPVVHFEHDHK